MKITKRQLRRIIREERSRLLNEAFLPTLTNPPSPMASRASDIIKRLAGGGILKEYEQYVDEDGNVYDDEGNVTKRGSSFGKAYGNETYVGTRRPWNRRKSPHSPPAGSIRGKQLKAIQDYLQKKPNKFLKSLADQMRDGKRLSKKQELVMNRIMKKADPANAKIFSEGRLRITEKQLKKLINETLKAREG